MKNSYLRSLAFTLFLCAFSTTLLIAKPVHIKGKILNHQQGEVRVIQSPYMRMPEVVELAKTTIDNAGQFELEFEITSPMSLSLVYGEHQQALFLLPEDELEITFDANDLRNSFQFAGKGASRQQFLQDDMQLYIKKEGDLGKNPMSLTSGAYLAFQQEMKEARLQHLKKANQAAQFPQTFIDFVETGFIGDFHTHLSNYPDYHKYLTEKDELVLVDDFQEAVKAFRFEPARKSYHPIYLHAIDLYYKAKNNETSADYLNVIKLEERARLMAQELPSEVYQPILANMLYAFLEESKRTEDNQQLYTSVSPLLQGTLGLQWIDAFIAKKEQLSEGKPAPEITVKDQEGNTVMLSQFKGKVIYIDVWATFCGPCMVEFPHLKSLAKHFKNRDDFVILLIANDKNTEKWLEISKKKGATQLGVNTIDSDGWGSEFMNTYLVAGYPTYLLIDQAGNIVSSNAPRPSSGKELIKLIERTLAEKSK